MNDIWNADSYAFNTRFVSDLGAPLLDLLAPYAGERVLDLGCGDGALTEKLIEAGCRVVGIDSSPNMIEAARARGLDAHVADAEALAFEAEFHAVFSNAALHWMLNPTAVLAGVWRALRPGGRFIGEMGGHGNVCQIVDALTAALQRHGVPFSNPWFFPSNETWRALLENAGFEIVALHSFPRPTLLKGDVRNWLDTFTTSLFANASPELREQIVTELVEELRPRLCDASGNWFADYVRLRFAARKPS